MNNEFNNGYGNGQFNNMNDGMINNQNQMMGNQMNVQYDQSQMMNGQVVSGQMNNIPQQVPNMMNNQMNMQYDQSQIMNGQVVSGQMGNIPPQDSNMMNNGQVFTINNGNNTPQVPDNMTKGLIGAIGGALLGAIVLIVFYQLGRVAVVSGIAIAALTLLGYEKLGGRLNKKALIICVVIMAGVIFLAHNLAVSIELSSEFKKVLGYDISPWEIFSSIFDYLNNGTLNSGVYWGNLLLNYVFCAIGAFSIIKDKLEQIKNG